MKIKVECGSGNMPTTIACKGGLESMVASMDLIESTVLESNHTVLATERHFFALKMQD